MVTVTEWGVDPSDIFVGPPDASTGCWLMVVEVEVGKCMEAAMGFTHL